jgi:hypothetical protein
MPKPKSKFSAASSEAQKPRPTAVAPMVTFAPVPDTAVEPDAVKPARIPKSPDDAETLGPSKLGAFWPTGRYW